MNLVAGGDIRIMDDRETLIARVGNRAAAFILVVVSEMNGPQIQNISYRQLGLLNIKTGLQIRDT